MSLIRKFLALLDRRERAGAAVLFGLMLVAALLEAFGTALIMPFIAVVQDPTVLTRNALALRLQSMTGIHDPRTFLELCALALIGLFVFKPLYLGFVYYVQFRFAFHLQAKLARRLLTTYLTASYADHLRRNSADAIRNLNVEIAQVIVQVLLPLFMITIEGLVTVGMLITLIYIQPLAALGAMVLLGLGGGGFYWVIRQRAERVGRRKVALTATMIRWVNQAFGGFKEMKAHQAERYFIDSFDEASRGYARAMRYSRLLSELPRLGIEAVTLGGLLLIIFVMLVRGENSSGLFPIVAVVGMAGVRLMPSVNRIIGAVGSFRYYAPSVEAIWNDLGKQDAGLEIGSRSPAPSFSESIEVRDVSYRYPDSRGEALRQIDLRIARGEWVALVGISGSGKSTLADILLGLLTPTTGEVRVDGRSIRGQESAWRRQIGYIPQPTYLLDDSIRRNVAFGVDDASIDDEQVWSSLRDANVDEFVRALPRQLETTLGEFGSRLSGGQRQRIGIARALYHDPAVLVLDEATSALDNETEKSIREMLARLKGRKTIVTIAHRLASVTGCDRIVVLKDGGIVDMGSFERLNRESLEFARIAGSG